MKSWVSLPAGRQQSQGKSARRASAQVSLTSEARPWERWRLAGLFFSLSAISLGLPGLLPPLGSGRSLNLSASAATPKAPAEYSGTVPAPVVPSFFARVSMFFAIYVGSLNRSLGFVRAFSSGSRYFPATSE